MMRMITQEEMDVLIPIFIADGKSIEEAKAHIKFIDDALDLQKVQSLLIPKRGKKNYSIKSFLDCLEDRLEQAVNEINQCK